MSRHLISSFQASNRILKTVKAAAAVLILIFSVLTSQSWAENSSFERIISLSPPITESLFLLGAQSSLVGCTSYCTRPEQAKEKEKVGDIVDINLEKILTLKPDLVIASELTPGRVKDGIRSLGLTLEVFGNPSNFSDLCNQFLSLGRLINRKEEASAIVDDAEAKVRALSESTASEEKASVLIVIANNPLFVAPKKSFLSDMLKLIHAENVSSESSSGITSIEEVLKKDPDVIIIAAHDQKSEEAMEYWKQFDSLKAVKNGRLYMMDSYILCSPTPVSFTEAVQKMASLVYPGHHPVSAEKSDED